jgi:hypothetical protein
MAALCHTAIGSMRWAGETHSTAACRRFADQPVLALELIGMQVENCMALGLYVHALTSADFHAQYTLLARFTLFRMPTQS